MKSSLNKGKLRVLHILGSLDLGGVETWLMHILRHIDRDLIHMDFLCLSGIEGSYADEARSLGSEIIPTKLTKNLLSFNQSFAHILDVGDYDIVHSHVHFFSGYILRQSVNSNVLKRIAHSFTSPPIANSAIHRRIYQNLMQSWIKKYATNGLGNSEDSMRSLFGKSWREDSRYQLLYCGIDLQPFHLLPPRSDLRNQLGIPSGAPVVGHLGRATEAKNQKFFLEIAKSIQMKDDSVWFVLVGDGPLRPELEMICQQYNLRKVVFTGRVKDVVPYLSMMDLLLFPSLWEGLPQSVIEAQAADVICLCSDIITKEVSVIRDAVFFKSLEDSAADWAETCLSLLQKPNLPKGYGVAKLEESPFSIKNNIQQLTQIYLQGIS